MLQGYYLMPEDNDSVMFENKDYNQCPKCGLKIGSDINLELILGINKYDFSTTYDGYIIVSNNFKEFCEIEKLLNLAFTPLVLYKDFWLFDTKNILEFDTMKRKTQLINLCTECYQYREVIGANPVTLKQSYEIKEGIHKTDIIFGSNNSKSPLLIAGIETTKKMKEMKFSGIFYKEVLYMEKLMPVKK
ncbi:MAG: hypothetical protein WAR79_00230 [Melioribacteraceae bacterium]